MSTIIGRKQEQEEQGKAGERCVSSRLVPGSYVLTKGLALRFLAAKAKRSTMVASKV